MVKFKSYTPEEQVMNFWNNVNKDGSIPAHMSHLGKCWEWTGGLTSGYGCIKWDRKVKKANRVSWELNYEKIPDGLFVLHKCDNRKCVNPSHLFLGTKQDNAIDRERKKRGRDSRGEKSGHSKLIASQVIEIRALYKKGGIKQSQIAEKYNIDQTTVSRIVRMQDWKHI